MGSLGREADVGAAAAAQLLEEQIARARGQPAKQQSWSADLGRGRSRMLSAARADFADDASAAHSASSDFEGWMEGVRAAGIATAAGRRTGRAAHK
jgi:hypothetical protein